jgi:hypothetical protein
MHTNVSALNFINHTLQDLKPHVVPNTVVVGDINIPIANRQDTQTKINKEILELNDTIDLMELTHVSRIFHIAKTQHTFFSGAHGCFSKLHHILGHKGSLNKYKKIEITP